MAMQLRNDWLEQTREEILEPDRPIVDPHHHFFRPGGGFPAYDLEDLWADTSGHNVVATVFAQCGEGYRTDGPPHLAPVGETEWVEDIAKRADAAGATAIVFTDIRRDGTGQGANLEATVEFASGHGVPVIVSGGVATIDDVRSARAAFDAGANLGGVIIGRALYEGAVDLAEAVRIGRGDS